MRDSIVAYSGACTLSSRSNVVFSFFFSLEEISIHISCVHAPNISPPGTHSFDLGYRLAASLTYSSPSTYFVHLCSACFWSLDGLNSFAFNLRRNQSRSVTRAKSRFFFLPYRVVLAACKSHMRFIQQVPAPARQSTSALGSRRRHRKSLGAPSPAAVDETLVMLWCQTFRTQIKRASFV